MTQRPDYDKTDPNDIVQRLRREFDQIASCRCGGDMSGNGCDNHSPTWNPCPDSQLLHAAITHRKAHP